MSVDRSITIVEIGARAIKLASFDPRAAAAPPRVWRYESFEDADGSVEAALRRAADGAGVSRRHAIGCLPRDLATVRMLDLPSTDPVEIAGMVDLQFGKQVPYSRDEVMAVYRILGATRGGYTRVMLLVVQRGVLRERFSLLEGAGFEIEAMTVASEGVAAWAATLDAAREGRAVLVLDVDADSAEFLAVRNDEILFTRALSFGARGMDQAEERDRLVAEVGRSIEACRAELPDLDAGTLILSGAAALTGLRDSLEQGLDVAVERHTVADGVAGAEGNAAWDAVDRAVSATALVGLAIRGERPRFRLAPEATRMRRALAARARRMWTIGALAIALSFIGSWYAVSKHALRRHRIAELSARRSAVEPAVRDIEAMRAVARAVAAREGAHLAAANVLAAIHAATPPDVFFDAVEIDRDRGRVVLRGSAEARPAVSALVNGLKASPLFVESREEGETARDRLRRFRFQVVGELAGGGDGDAETE